MAYAGVVPTILYPSGAANPTVLTFFYPPTQVPAYWVKAVRHDNISDAGVRDAIVENLTNWIGFNMEWVVAGADVAAWDAFMQTCALLGLYFDYYPGLSRQSSLTSLYVNDSGSQTWQIGVTDAGELETMTASSRTPSPIYLLDIVTSQTFLLGITTDGELTTTLSTPPPTGILYVLISSGGIVWSVGTSNGELETSNGSFTTYRLEGNVHKAEYRSPGYYKFSCIFRAKQ